MGAHLSSQTISTSLRVRACTWHTVSAGHRFSDLSRVNDVEAKAWATRALALFASVAVCGDCLIYDWAYFYFDSRSVDAHLARATQAKLVEDSTTAIREYREALKREDDPHIHKLLAIELANAGYISEAITEFRLAEQGGETDDCGTDRRCEAARAKITQKP